MQILLVRHGQTEGNKIHRFVGGRTDEPVTEEGLADLAGRRYPAPEHVFTSPMRRCLQTARTIFPGQDPETVEGFRECDFGILEGKTHKELPGGSGLRRLHRRGGGGHVPRRGEHPRL